MVEAFQERSIMKVLVSFLIAKMPEILFAADTSTKKTTNQAGTSAYMMWVLIVVMLVVFYFLLIRPQRKKAQEHEQMISKLKKGDEVVTIGGIYGTIKRIGEDFVVLEVDKNVRIKISRSAISKRISPVEEEEEPEETEPEVEDLDEVEADYEEEIDGEDESPVEEE